MRVRHGFSLYIPLHLRTPVAEWLYLYGEYEPEVSAVIKSILKSGDLVYDVGANVGYTTCLMAAAVDDGRVCSFEPEPVNFDLLLHNTKLNRFNQVIACQLALSDKSGSCIMYTSSANTADHTLVKMEGRKSLVVECITFDDFHSRHFQGAEVALVKIDVQGSEMRVLEGMAASLRSGIVQAILMEIWPSRLQRAGTPSWQLWDFLAEIGYEGTMVDGLGRDQPSQSLPIDASSNDSRASFNALLRFRGTPSRQISK